MNLVQLVQEIALKAVLANSPMAFATGTVTSVSPLKIRLDESNFEIFEEEILLTEPVIEKTLTLNAHTHAYDETLQTHVHDYVLEGATVPTAPDTSLIGKSVDNTVLSGVCTEHGNDLPTSTDSDKITITLNRALETGDKVLMLSCENGQQYIVLSRVFEG